MADVVFADDGGVAMDPQTMRSLLEALGLSTWRYDPRTETVTWRPGVAARDLGRSSTIREPLADLLHRYQNEDKPRLAAHYEEAFRTGRSGPVRFRVRRRNGALIYIESVAVADRDEAGASVLSGLMRDCRHDILSEHALAGINSLMQQLIDRSRSAVIATDGDQKIRHYNKNVHGFLALDPKMELRGTRLKVLGALRNIDLAAAFEAAFHGGRDVRRRIEIEIDRSDRRVFGLRAYRWFRPNGRPGGVVIRIENTDDARVIEAREATQRMMDALPDIYFVFDTNSGLFRFANRTARERLGLRSDDLTTHSVVETAMTRSDFHALEAAVAAKGAVSDVAMALTSTVGPKRPVIASAAQVNWENVPSILVAARQVRAAAA